MRSFGDTICSLRTGYFSFADIPFIFLLSVRQRYPYTISPFQRFQIAQQQRARQERRSHGRFKSNRVYMMTIDRLACDWLRAKLASMGASVATYRHTTVPAPCSHICQHSCEKCLCLLTCLEVALTIFPMIFWLASTNPHAQVWTTL